MLVWDTEEFSDPVMAEFAEIWRPLEKIVFSDLLDDSPICIKLMR